MYLVRQWSVRNSRLLEWLFPDFIIKRLLSADNQKEEGAKICIEMIQRLREIDGVHGVHVMAYRQEECVPEIINALGVLGGRSP